MATTEDHYLVLEVSRTATEAEIRVAYRKLAREHHPDANPTPEAEARMRRINEAWDVLRDAAKRSDYDRSLPKPFIRSMRRQPPPRAAAPARERPQAKWFEGEDAPRAEARPSDEYTGDITINWYRELGVREDAPRQEILKALSKMAAGLSGADISATEFTRRRTAMRDGWAVLGDQYLRAAYDRARRQAPSNPAPSPPPEPPVEAQAAPATPPPPPGFRVGPVTVNGHVVDTDATLPGADLRGASLRGLDLAGIDLSGAKLQGADLEAASLRKANLAGADLSGANLRFADLSNADATAATLRQADLEGAALNATKLFRANLSGASLVDAVGPGINLDFADLARADLSGARITVQLIERARLEGTILPDGTRSA